MTSKEVVTNKWTFEDEAYIELPISCSIKSEQIKCGAMKLTTDNSVVIAAGPTRMKTIERSTTQEDKIKISEATFRGNRSTVAKPIINISGNILGINRFYWTIIGIAGGVAILLVMALCIGKYKCRSSETDQPNTRTTTIIHNNHPSSRSLCPLPHLFHSCIFSQKSVVTLLRILLVGMTLENPGLLCFLMSLLSLDSYTLIDRLSISGIIIILVKIEALHSLAFANVEKIEVCITVIPVRIHCSLPYLGLVRPHIPLVL